MAKSDRTKKGGDLPVRLLIARRNRALQRFDNHWRDAASKGSCGDEDAEIAFMLAGSDDPGNPFDGPGGIPPPPPPEDGEDEETTRTVTFSLRKSEKRVIKGDGELTVKVTESSTEVMHTSDDPIGPFDGPTDPIPPPPDPPEELMRLASDKAHGAHGTFARRREEISRRFGRQIEHAREWQKPKRLT